MGFTFGFRPTGEGDEEPLEFGVREPEAFDPEEERRRLERARRLELARRQSGYDPANPESMRGTPDTGDTGSIGVATFIESLDHLQRAARQGAIEAGAKYGHGTLEVAHFVDEYMRRTGEVAAEAQAAFNVAALVGGNIMPGMPGYTERLARAARGDVKGALLEGATAPELAQTETERKLGAAVPQPFEQMLGRGREAAIPVTEAVSGEELTPAGRAEARERAWDPATFVDELRALESGGVAERMAAKVAGGAAGASRFATEIVADPTNAAAAGAMVAANLMRSVQMAKALRAGKAVDAIVDAYRPTAEAMDTARRLAASPKLLRAAEKTATAGLASEALIFGTAMPEQLAPAAEAAKRAEKEGFTAAGIMAAGESAGAAAGPLGIGLHLAVEGAARAVPEVHQRGLIRRAIAAEEARGQATYLEKQKQADIAQATAETRAPEPEQQPLDVEAVEVQKPGELALPPPPTPEEVAATAEQRRVAEETRKSAALQEVERQQKAREAQFLDYAQQRAQMAQSLEDSGFKERNPDFDLNLAAEEALKKQGVQRPAGMRAWESAKRKRQNAELRAMEAEQRRVAEATRSAGTAEDAAAKAAARAAREAEAAARGQEKADRKAAQAEVFREAREEVDALKGEFEGRGGIWANVKRPEPWMRDLPEATVDLLVRHGGEQGLKQRAADLLKRWKATGEASAWTNLADVREGLRAIEDAKGNDYVSPHDVLAAARDYHKAGTKGLTPARRRLFNARVDAKLAELRQRMEEAAGQKSLELAETPPPAEPEAAAVEPEPNEAPVGPDEELPEGAEDFTPPERGPERRVAQVPVTEEHRRAARRAQIAAEAGLPPEHAAVEKLHGIEIDPKTDLPNNRARAADEAAGTWGGWASQDVSGLKKVNDLWGHDAGDQYLKDIAAVLREVAEREGGRAYRIGESGDEFALGAATPEEARRIARLQKEALAARKIQIFDAVSGEVLAEYDGARIDYGYEAKFTKADEQLAAYRLRAEARGERVAYRKSSEGEPGRAARAGGEGESGPQAGGKAGEASLTPPPGLIEAAQGGSRGISEWIARVKGLGAVTPETIASWERWANENLEYDPTTLNVNPALPVVALGIKAGLFAARTGLGMARWASQFVGIPGRILSNAWRLGQSLMSLQGWRDFAAGFRGDQPKPGEKLEFGKIAGGALRRTLMPQLTAINRMGRYGRAAAALLGGYERAWENSAGRTIGAYRALVSDLSPAAWGNVRKWLDSPDENVRAQALSKLSASEVAAAQKIRDLLNDVKARAKAAGVLLGEIPNYFPHLPTDAKSWLEFENALHRRISDELAARAELLRQQRPGLSRQAAAQLADKQLTDDMRHTIAAEMMGSGVTGFVRKFGPLEKSREGGLEYDTSKQAIERYLLGATRRISEASVLGRHHEIARQLIGKITDARDRAHAENTLLEMTGLGEKRGSAGFANVRGFVAASRLILGALTQATSVAQTATLAGSGQAVKDLVSVLGNEVGARVAARIGTSLPVLGSMLKHSLEAVKRDEGDALAVGALHTHLTDEWQDAMGLSTARFSGLPWMRWTARMDKVMRVAAVKSAKHVIPVLYDRANRGDYSARRDLELLGVDRTRPLEGQLDDGAKKFSDLTQFRSGAADLPAWATSPWGKMAVQFMNFSYQQTRLLGQLGREALAGNSKPLLRLMFMSGVAGELVSDAKAIVRGYGIESDAEEEDPEALFSTALGNKRIPLKTKEHLLARIIQSQSEGGAFGVLSPLLQKFGPERLQKGKQQGVEMLLGPAGQETREALEAVGSLQDIAFGKTPEDRAQGLTRLARFVLPRAGAIAGAVAGPGLGTAAGYALAVPTLYGREAAKELGYTKSTTPVAKPGLVGQLRDVATVPGYTAKQALEGVVLGGDARSQPRQEQAEVERLRAEETAARGELKPKPKIAPIPGERLERQRRETGRAKAALQIQTALEAGNEKEAGRLLGEAVREGFVARDAWRSWYKELRERALGGVK